MLRTLFIATTLVACSSSHGPEPVADKAAPAEPAKVVVVSRTKALRHYPCQRCHQHAEDGAGTVVNAHASIRLKHMPNGVCGTCHSDEQPGKLQLASGLVLELENMEELCAQCHSPQVADWRDGIHGKQLGNWRSEVHRLGCSSCHPPHRPAFADMSTLPPPPFPKFGIPKRTH